MSSKDELTSDSLDAIAGGKGNGWTKKQKKEVRAYCESFFKNLDEKFKAITTRYTYDQFIEELRRQLGGFKY